MEKISDGNVWPLFLFTKTAPIHKQAPISWVDEFCTDLFALCFRQCTCYLHSIFCSICAQIYATVSSWHSCGIPSCKYKRVIFMCSKTEIRLSCEMIIKDLVKNSFKKSSPYHNANTICALRIYFCWNFFFNFIDLVSNKLNQIWSKWPLFCFCKTVLNHEQVPIL